MEVDLIVTITEYRDGEMLPAALRTTLSVVSFLTYPPFRKLTGMRMMRGSSKKGLPDPCEIVLIMYIE